MIGRGKRLKEKKIKEKLLFFIYLCKIVREKKKIMISSNTFILMLLEKVIPTINIEPCKKFNENIKVNTIL